MDDALGLDDTADDILLLIAGVGLHNGDQSLQHLVDSLQELGLLGIAGSQILVNSVQIGVFDGHKKSFLPYTVTGGLAASRIPSRKERMTQDPFVFFAGSL